MRDDRAADAAWYAAMPENGIWVTQGGDEVSINKMTDTHIQNCIHMLLRKKGDPTGRRERYLDAFRKELHRRSREVEE